MPYVTIYIADRNTPKDGGGKSIAGHIWIRLDDGHGGTEYYGFAPETEFDWNGPGEVYRNDNEEYLQHQYSRTIEITEDQRADMATQAVTWNDDTYTIGQHDCVSFVWDVLEAGGLNPNSIDGSPLPMGNRSLIDAIGDLPEAIHPQGFEEISPAKAMFGQAPVTISPLVLDLDGDGIETTKMGYGEGASTVYFDLNNDDFAVRTGWVTGGDGLLAWDINANGLIDDQSELFGNSATYANGFTYLDALDTNSDNKITSADTNWSNLRVWVDANEDGITDSGELKTLATLGITEISVNSTHLTNTYNNENTVTDTATFVIGGQTRTISDVWFRHDNVDTRYLGDVELVEDVFFLPTLKGFGLLKDLHVAMSENSDLLDMVSDFVANWSTEKFEDNDALNAEIEDIIFTWAHVENVSTTSRGAYVDGQKLAFLEVLFNRPFVTEIGGTSSNPIGGGAQTGLINDSFNYMRELFKAQLIAQSGLDELYDQLPAYDHLSGEMIGGVLSADAISDLSAEASAATNATDYWTNVVRTLITIKDVAEFTDNEISALDDAIQTSLPSSSWNAILASATHNYYQPWIATDFSDQLVGHNYNDVIYASSGDDILVGNKGNDTLYGEAGNDTYKYMVGDGHDIVHEALSEGTDTLRMSGYNLADVIIYTSYTGALIVESRSNFTDYVTLSGAVAGETYENLIGLYVENIQFDDTTLSLTGGLSVEASNDPGAWHMLYGTAYNDTLNGKGGSDDAYGYSGDDTYIFTVGDDNDRVWEAIGEGTDTIRLVGYDPANIRLYTDYQGKLHIFNKLDVGDEIKVNASSIGETYASDIGQRVERIVFDNGTVWDLTGGLTLSAESYMNPQAVYGTNFNDTLIGNIGYDNLNGYDGNDTLIGGALVDKFYGGSGTDTASYKTAASGVTSSLASNATSNDGDGSNDILSSIENLSGSEFNDSLTGDGNANVLYGNGGNDTIDGGAGNDTVSGGAGNDTLVGGSNTDTLTYFDATAAVTVSIAIATAQNTGGAGTDTISTFENLTGSAFSDALTGDANANVIQGGDGDDTVEGGAGNDTLNGGNGTSDTLKYTSATSAITLSLALTSAQVTGGAGTDTVSNFENMIGSAYNDVLTGNANNNVIEGGAGNDTLNGGAGTGDTLKYSSATSAVTLSLALTSAQVTGGAGTDTVSNFENIIGSAYNDVLTGSSGNNVIEGGLGNDILNGDAGTGDTVTYSTATTAVTVNLATTTSQNTVGAGSDTISNFENLTGSGYNDTLTGNTGANVIVGGAGNDSISGGDGNDTLNGGAGNDTLNGGNGTDTVTYVSSTAAITVNMTAGTATGDGSDTLTAIENVTGSDFNDTLTGNTSANVLTGGAGNDTMAGGGGNDTVNGNGGNDILVASDGVDALYGGADSDVFWFNAINTNSDTIADFSLAQMDKIDISDILVGYNPLTSAITDFVQITTSGANSLLKVDVDGGANNFVQIATITGVTGLTDEAALAVSGNLIAA